MHCCNPFHTKVLFSPGRECVKRKHSPEMGWWNNFQSTTHLPANIYLFKVNNKNTRTAVVTSFRCFYLTLNIFHTFSSISIVEFEQVNAIWVNDLPCFFPKFPFHPPENIVKSKLFWCFQGNQKGTFWRKRLIMYFVHTCSSRKNVHNL